MKAFLPTQELLQRVEETLGENRPSFRHSPLETVARILADGRHYGWVGIYLKLDAKSAPQLLENVVNPAEFAALRTRKKVIVSMKIAGREVGFLNIESDREYAFGSEERVLLERVAYLLAKFLVGPGKYLFRRAAQASAAPQAAAA